MAASSARNRQSSQPEMVMKTVIGIDEAPSEVTMTGAMPVTKIVPARPMTKAPHQPVSRLSPPETYPSSWEAVVCLGSPVMFPPVSKRDSRIEFFFLGYQEKKFLTSAYIYVFFMRRLVFLYTACARFCAAICGKANLARTRKIMCMIALHHIRRATATGT